MELKGQITLFLNNKKGGRYYQTSISKKEEDGKYTNFYVDCIFAKELQADFNPSEIRSNVTMVKLDVEGFWSASKYTTKEGIQKVKPIIVIQKAVFNKLNKNC